MVIKYLSIFIKTDKGSLSPQNPNYHQIVIITQSIAATQTTLGHVTVLSLYHGTPQAWKSHFTAKWSPYNMQYQTSSRPSKKASSAKCPLKYQTHLAEGVMTFRNTIKSKNKSELVGVRSNGVCKNIFHMISFCTWNHTNAAFIWIMVKSLREHFSLVFQMSFWI